VASLSYIRGVFDSSFFIVEEKMKISVYGSSGFIGGTFCNLFSEDVIKIPRDQRKPESKNILYLISTISNYNVFDNLNLDVDTNLTVQGDFIPSQRELLSNY
jgi:hypothetical protein